MVDLAAAHSQGTLMLQVSPPSLPDSRERTLRLLHQVIDFNLRPQRDAHPSWLPPEWPLRHRAPRGEVAGAGGVLAGSVRHAEPGAHAVEYDFDLPLRRVALLDSIALRRLAAYCGFVVHRPAFKLRGVGAELRRQARRYDADATHFVLQRAPRLDRFTMNTAALEARPHGAGRLIVHRGCRLLLAALASQGDAILRGAMRKLPRRVCDGRLPELDAAQRDQLCEVMLLCIVPERLPEWDWLF